MKLRTEMVHTSRAHYPVFLGDRQPGDIDHEVMAAHALMQAMDEDEDERDCEYTGDPMIRLMQRADEVLAGWTGAGE